MKHPLKTILAVFSFILLSSMAHAADKSPDELFPAQSQQSYIKFQSEAAQARQKDMEAAKNPENWSSPGLSNKPATYGDLAILKKEIDELKAAKNGQ